MYGYLAHHGILGQKWGIRRYQNPDGSLTEEGRRRYGSGYYNKNNAPEKTYNEMKAIHEAEKQGNLKGVYENYFSKDPTSVSLSQKSEEIRKLGKSLDKETEKTLQDTFGNKEIISNTIKDCIENIYEENHSDKYQSDSNLVYWDDIYDYYLNAYADNLKKSNPKLKELEDEWKNSERSYKKDLESYVDTIVGDIGNRTMYSEKGMFGFTIEPKFVYEVKNAISSVVNNNLTYNDYYYGEVKNYIDQQEYVVDDLYNYSKEIEDGLKEKGLRLRY